MQPNQPQPNYQPAPPPLQPQQQFPQQQQPAPNPYGFIMDDPVQKKPAGPLKIFNGNSQKARIALVAGGFLFLLIIGWVLLSLLSAGNGAQNEKLLSLAQQQTEIIRVSNLAENSRSIRSTATRNLAVNGSAVMVSSKKDVVALLAKNKMKVKDKQLAGASDSKIDAKLAAATNNNTFDQTFVEIYKGLLQKYQRSVKDAFDSSKSATEKATLQTSYTSVGILLKE